MASRSPVKTSETPPDPDPAGSTAGPGLTGGAGGGGGGEERSGKNVGQLISRRIRARAPSIEVRWPGGGGPGGGHEEPEAVQTPHVFAQKPSVREDVHWPDPDLASCVAQVGWWA